MAERTQCARPGQRRHLLEAAPRGQTPVGVSRRHKCARLACGENLGSDPGGGQSPSQMCTPLVGTYFADFGARLLPAWGQTPVGVSRRHKCARHACGKTWGQTPVGVSRRHKCARPLRGRCIAADLTCTYPLGMRLTWLRGLGPAGQHLPCAHGLRDDVLWRGEWTGPLRVVRA